MLQIPLTCTFFNISNLALCGFPFLAGFYSKDLILEVCSLNYLNILIYFLFYFSTGLTMCYSLRLCYYSIIGNLNFTSFFNLRDEGVIILKGIRGLFIIVIFSGSVLSWLIFPTPSIICLPLLLKIIALIVSLIGGFIGYNLAKISLRISRNSLFLVKYLYFISSIWYIPFLSTLGVNYYFLKLGFVLVKNFDQGWSEYLGGQGIYKVLGNNSKILQFMEVNNLKIYLLIFILWLVILVFIF